MKNEQEQTKGGRGVKNCKFWANVHFEWPLLVKFSFRPVSIEEVKKIIQSLKTNKAVGG